MQCYRASQALWRSIQPDDMMVVSAAGSTTNQLISCSLSQTDRLLRIRYYRRYAATSDLISGCFLADAADDLTSAY
ncbi:hypothetical protein KCP74_03965 [Salmonella enterica subsp. enterica]|nr:hypothetical protein KCP74_03965 [Salmonella enterica subsp. enterica]